MKHYEVIVKTTGYASYDVLAEDEEDALGNWATRGTMAYSEVDDISPVEVGLVEDEDDDE